MSTITKEWLQQKIAGMEATRDEIPFGLDEDGSNSLAALRIALASLEAEPVPEWTNKQCLEFLSIAFRHAEINGDLQLDDIRLGVKMVNGSRAAMLQGADGNSPVIPDGWVMVPVEPTPDMREAYHQAQAEYEDSDGLWSPDHQWQAMLAAAPQQEVK
ncbi:hypothetical protein POV90_21685 [Enterobacter roggenkampii]|uniref:hypothetical protein n=1 Tax=Enterobacter roggenkampii TaxID=1812935 RepID=UPI002FFC4BA5